MTHCKPSSRQSPLPAILWLGVLVALVAAALPSLAADRAVQEAPDEPRLALDGLDPVLLVRGSVEDGSEERTEDHGPFRYRFASGETRDAFRADPERFAIRNTQCPVVPTIEADPSHFTVHEGGLYIFASARCIDEFEVEPARYLEGRDAERLRVAVLVYEGVELLDFAGPGEVFAAAGHGRAFEVYTVGPSRRPVTSQGFVEVTPEYTLDDAPSPDLVVIPGGGVGPLLQPAAQEWLRAQAPRATLLSVCNGALALAEAGLLDGLEATTHHGSIDSLRRRAPRTRVVTGRRWVDNGSSEGSEHRGRVVTAAGVSAGIDAALHLVSSLRGRDAALATARYMEYPWEADHTQKIVQSAAADP